MGAIGSQDDSFCPACVYFAEASGVLLVFYSFFFIIYIITVVFTYLLPGTKYFDGEVPL